MSKSESEILEYIEKLIEESINIAPSISRYKEDGT